MLKITKEILSEYKDTPEGLTNAVLGVLSFAVNLAELFAMLDSKIGEVAKNIPNIVSGLSNEEKVYFSAYISVHLAHEFASTSKLKLLKLTKKDSFKIPKWLSSSKRLQINIIDINEKVYK